MAPQKGPFRNRPKQKQEQKQKPRTAVFTAAAQAIRGRTYSRNSQSSTATPAEPGDLPFGIDDPGLLRMQLQLAVLQPSAHGFQHELGLLLAHAVDHNIISVALERNLRKVAPHQFVERIVHVEIGQRREPVTPW